MPSQRQLAQEYRRQQAALNAAVTAGALRLWLRGWVPDRPDLWQALLNLLNALVTSRRTTSAGLAAAYYRRARSEAGIPGRFDIKLTEPPPPRLIDVTAEITGPQAYERVLKAGRSPEQAKQTAGVQLAGSMSRLVQDAGRRTVRQAVEDDDAAIGWMRVTDADPCSWCAMLASQGVEYKSAKSAGRDREFTVARRGRPRRRFLGEGTAKFHDHCGCSVVAVWDVADNSLLHEADGLYQRWKDATEGSSGNGARNAWRRYWEALRAGQSEHDALKAAKSGGRPAASRS